MAEYRECAICFTTRDTHQCGDAWACQKHCPVINETDQR